MNKSILMKLITRIGIPIFLIFTLLIFFNYKTTKENAIQNTQKHLIELTKHNAEKLDKEFEQLSHTASGLRNLIESTEQFSQQETFEFIKKEMKNDPDNVGAGVAFLPSKNKGKKFANFVREKEGKFIDSDITKSYDYLKEDWFVIPKTIKKGYWTEPFWGRVSETLLMVRAFPIQKKKEVIGVSYADISLEILSKLTQKVRFLNGYTFIISKNGTFIYHPKEDFVMTESIFSLAEQYNRPDLREIGREMLHSKSGVLSYKDLDNDQKKWIVFAPIRSTGWSFAAVIPESFILKDVRKIIFNQIAIMLLGLCFVLLIIVYVAGQVSEPLHNLSEAANEIATGNLELELQSIQGQDEVASLGHSFQKMTKDLQHYVQNLTAIMKAKEAVESEMRIARQIQESLLPRIFPAFPDRKEFDLFAQNIAAKEVAGDFYDFFFLNENLMAVIIADVSGKGISAGLFMAVTRTLLKTVCSEDLSPAEALTKANDILCQDNDACMFTTLFLGFYDVNSGKIQYSNAGHDYPYILSENGCELIKTKQDIALGIDEDHIYQNGELYLKENQTLVLYTDGVIEATSSNKELYGEERLTKKLQSSTHLPLEQMMQSLTDELAEFQENNQFDDITMLFLKRSK